MKTFVLRIAVLWRRFRRLRARGAKHLQHAEQLGTLMRRANPFASWIERANWLIDVAEWIGREPEVSRLDHGAWTRIKQQRTRLLLDWLDGERSVQRVVRATVQKTLREAGARQLFAASGLPRGPAPFSERVERFVARFMPQRLAPRDLPGLLAALFARPADANWLLTLDGVTIARLWKLCADQSLQHACRTQLDDALLYLVTAVAAAGLDPEFTLEEQACIPLQAMPFMVLRRELEIYLSARSEANPTTRGVRMLVALCQTHLDRVVEQLERSGMSLAAARRIQVLRTQLERIAVLSDVRSTYGKGECHAHVQRLLADMLGAASERAAASTSVASDAARVARTMAERSAARRTGPAGRDMRAIAWSACVGGAVAAGGAIAQLALARAGLAPFFEGVFVSAGYAGCLLMLAALGGVLATRQPIEAAVRLAAGLKSMKTGGPGLRGALRQLAGPAREHVVATLSNLLGAGTAALVIGSIAAPLLPKQALATIQGLSPFGPTLMFAGVTGVFVWLACLAGEWAEARFAQCGACQALAQHRDMLRVLGPVRAARCAEWLQRRVALIASSLALAGLMGMTPAAAHFFGVPFEVRHAVLSAASLASAAGTLGWAVLESREFWLALAGVASCWLLNAGLVFVCSFGFAVQDEGMAPRMRRLARLTLMKSIARTAGAWLPRGRRAKHLKLVSAAPGYRAKEIGTPERVSRRNR